MVSQQGIRQPTKMLLLLLLLLLLRQISRCHGRSSGGGVQMRQMRERERNPGWKSIHAGCSAAAEVGPQASHVSTDATETT